MKTLAGMSKFVVAELSGPSVPKELEAIVSNFEIPLVPLAREGTNIYSMFEDHLAKSMVLVPVPYRDEEDLVGKVRTHVVAAAEKKAEEHRAQYEERLKRHRELWGPK